MAFALSGTTINQTGTDTGSANLVAINGITELAGNRQLAGTSRQINVQGNYTVRESIRLQRFVVSATGNLTLGQVDGNGVVMPCVIYLTTTTGFAYPSQAISCDDGATLSLNNSVVVVETGNNNAGFGSFNKLNWTFNALNSEIIHEQRAWDYLAGNGVIKNLTVRNTRCIFFHGSPTELSNLTVIDTEWGIGIDNSTGATVRVTKSKTPRSMIQRGNNYFNMVDTQITEWIGSRFEPSATSGWRFIKTMQTASVGALANANTTAHTLASDNSTLDSTALGAAGSLVKEVQWGRVLGDVAGLSSSPDNLSNKITASMINTNTGTYKHVAGDYKLPLAVAFVSYNGELQVQEGITFDVSADAYRDNFIMAPNLGVDPLVTELSQAVANAYTTQVGSIRLYDKGKAVFASSYSNERAVYISRVGTTLTLGSKSFTATAASVFSQSLTAIVATAAVWPDNIMTTGAVVLDAIAEGKTIDGAVSVKLTTLPTKLTIKNSAQGILLETAGTYDLSEFVFEGGTVNYTKIGNNAITIKTGGKTLVGGGVTTGLTIDNTVPKRFFGMPTGLPATATPILLEELDSSGNSLNPKIYLEPFSSATTGDVSVSLKPNTNYDWKADAIGYERSNGDTFKRIDTATHTGDIEITLNQILYPAGGAIYGNGNASHLALMALDVATVQCRFGNIPAGEHVSFETGVQFVEDKLTSHFAMKAGLRQPSLNPDAKEIIWRNDSPLTISDVSTNTRVVELDFVSKKVNGTLTLASPFNSSYGVRMPQTIITATGGNVNIASVNGTSVTIDDFKAKADIYTDKYVLVSLTDPNRASGTVYGVNGTNIKPCDNMSDAVTIAKNNNLGVHVQDGSFSPSSLPGAFAGIKWRGNGLSTRVNFDASSGWQVFGVTMVNMEVSFAPGWLVSNTNGGIDFDNVKFVGNFVVQSGSTPVGQFKMRECLMSGVTCQSLYATNSKFLGDLVVSSNLSINGCGGFVNLSYTGSIIADLANFVGNIVISATNTGDVSIYGGSGVVTITAGAAGTIRVSGRNKSSVVDNSGGSATVIITDGRGVSGPSDVNVIQIGGNVVTGPTDLRNTPTEIHAALDSYGNKSGYHSTIPSSINANVIQVGGNAVTGVADFQGEMSATELHAALDSYTNKDNWKANVSNLSADVNVVQVAGVAVTGITDFKDKNTPADIHTALDSYANKDNWKANVSNLSADVNVVQVGGVAVTGVADFKDKNTQAEVHGFLDSYTNKDNWKADVTGVATLLNGVNVTQVGGNAVTGTADFHTPAAGIHTALDSYTNKDNWKANVSNLSADVNVVQVAGVAVTGITDFKNTATDIHTALDSYTNKGGYQANLSTLEAGVNVTQVGGNAITGASDFHTPAAGIHSALDSYGNKGNWFGPGINEAGLHGFLDSYANKGNWQDEANAGEIHAALDAYANKSDWFGPGLDTAGLHAGLTSYTGKGDWKNTQVEIHTFLDSYANKDAWKANVSNLSADVNVVQVAGVAVTGISDFRDQMNATELHTALDSYANKGDWATKNTPADIHTALDSYGNKDNWKLGAAALHTALDAYANKGAWATKNTQAEVHGFLDSYTNKGAWAGKNTQAEVHGFLDSYTNKDNWKLGAAGLHTALDSYTNKADWQAVLPEASFHSYLNSYTNKDNWKLDPSGITITANVTQVAGVAVTGIADFKDKNTQAEVHGFLDSYANKDNWKATVTGANVNANIVSVTGTNVTDINDFHDKADVTGVLAAIAGLHNLGVTDLHGALDSYGNKATWAAKNTETEIHTFLNNYTGKNAWKATVDFAPVLTAISGLNDVTPAQVRAAFDPIDFQGKNTQAEIHTALDSYANKDNWKANVSNLSADVNVVSVAGTSVAGPNDLRSDLSTITPVIYETRNRAKYTAENTAPLKQNP